MRFQAGHCVGGSGMGEGYAFAHPFEELDGLNQHEGQDDQQGQQG